MEQRELNRIVAANLVRYRKAAGMTQLELAERINYSDKSVSKWERGDGMPDVFVLYSLAEIYGVTVNDFLYEHTEKPPVPKKRFFFSRGMIMAMSVGLCWLVAVIVFVLLKIILPDCGYSWLTFIYALPASFIVMVVLSTVWKFEMLSAVSASLIIWTALLAICLTVWLPLRMNSIFLLLFIGLPLQALVVMWFVFRKKIPKKKE